MLQSHSLEQNLLAKVANLLKKHSNFFANLKRAKNKREVLENITKTEFSALLFIVESLLRPDRLLCEYLDEDIIREIEKYPNFHFLRDWYINDPPSNYLQVLRKLLP